MAGSMLGNTVNWLGTQLGLPEMGIGEALGGNRAPYIGPETMGQGSVLGVNNEAMGPSGAPAGYRPPGTTQNQVSNRQPVQQNSNPPMQSNPEQSSINWDEVYQPAFEALSQAEQASQSGYQSDVQGAQQEYAANTADLQNEQKSRMSDFGEQRQTNTKSTEGAIAEARRMASQIQQGLQSQYGGSTGTGQFRGELLGQQATANISNNRAALQTALTGIAKSESALKDKVLTLQNSLDQQLQSSKMKLKAGLDQMLAQISQSRGQLAVDKGARRADALSQYRQQLAQVDAANTQFKQQLYLEAQQQAQKIASLKQSTQDKFTANLKTANFTNGQQFTVGDTVYQVAPTSTGEIEYLKGTKKDKTDELANPFATQ